MKFNSKKEMYELIVSGVDIYNQNEELYVFMYNEDGDLCCYCLDKQEAKSIAHDADNTNDCWSAFLGVGGYIIDNADDFCERYYNYDGWMTTKEFAVFG